MPLLYWYVILDKEYLNSTSTLRCVKSENIVSLGLQWFMSLFMAESEVYWDSGSIRMFEDQGRHNKKGEHAAPMNKVPS